MHITQETILLIFTGTVAIGIMLQVFVMLGILIASRKASSRMLELGEELRHISEDIRSTAVPAIRSAHKLIEDISPPLRNASQNLSEITTQLREQTGTIGRTLEELSDKTRIQADRVDGMVTSVLDSLTHATEIIRHSVAVPVRQLSGILSAVRIGIDTLRGKTRPATPDKDIFI